MNPRLSPEWLRYLVTVGGFERDDGWRWKIDPALRMGGFGPWRPEWSLRKLPGLQMPILALLAGEPEVMGWSTSADDVAGYVPDQAVLETWEGRRPLHPHRTAGAHGRARAGVPGR